MSINLIPTYAQYFQERTQALFLWNLFFLNKLLNRNHATWNNHLSDSEFASMLIISFIWHLLIHDNNNKGR